MRLKTQLAIKADIEGQAPVTWSRKNFEVLLKQNREQWSAPQSLTTSGLIGFLIDNQIVRPVEIQSKAYNRKMRYILGRPSPLQFALSFFKSSFLSHASALEVHGLGRSEMIRTWNVAKVRLQSTKLIVRRDPGVRRQRSYSSEDLHPAL